MIKKLMIVLLLLAFTLSGCSEYKGDVVTENAKQILQRFKNKETFVVVAGQGSCESCKEYSDTLHELTKYYDIIIYYLEVDSSEYVDEKNELIYDYFYRCLRTPTTYIVVDGKTEDVCEEIIGYDELVEWLNEYGLLSE